MLLEAPGDDAPYLDAEIRVDGDSRTVSFRGQFPARCGLGDSLTDETVTDHRHHDIAVAGRQAAVRNVSTILRQRVV